MLGVHRPAGFDYGAGTDAEDEGSGLSDAFWGRCKRMGSSGPMLCSLNTNCVDIPEVWSKAAAPEEASFEGGAVAEGIERPRCSGEVEPTVGCVGNPIASEGELLERPRKKNKLAKRVGGVGVRQSPRLSKVTVQAKGLTCAVGPPQLLEPLEAQKPDATEVAKVFSVISSEGEDRPELEPVELFKCSNKATDTLESLASCSPGQRQECSPEAGSIKNLGVVARRQSTRLLKDVAYTNESDVSVALPELSTSYGTIALDTFTPPNNLGGDAFKEHHVGLEFVESSASSKKPKSPRSSTTPSLSSAQSLERYTEARSMEGCNGTSQRQKDMESSVVLALPCLSKLAKKPINGPRGRLPHLTKDTAHGNVCNPTKPSALPKLTGSLATQNNLSSAACKKDSPRYATMEKVMRYLDDLEESCEPCETGKRGNRAGETGSLEDSTNECQDQSLQLEEDGDCDSVCELSKELYKPMSVTEIKMMQATSSYPSQRIISGQGPEHIAGPCKAESLDIISSTVKKIDKKKEAHSKKIVTRKMVKETLRLFQAICRKLLREEETKSRKPCHNNRVDMMALSLIKEKGKCLNIDEHHFGSVPGVEIGDEFCYRAELSIIGLHRNILAGVNYAKRDGMYIASSIVSYEGYFDFMQRSDVLLYSGSAGYPNHRNKNEKHLREQKLEHGNLALKNSMDVQIPIRVVLGLKEQKATDCRILKAKRTVTYVYDGLYLVERYWSEKGNRGFSIFKFQLRRMPAQRQLAIKEIQNSKGLKVHRGLHMEDLSQGKEKIPVGVVNTMDDVHPLPFRYINRIIYPPWHKLPPPKGCDCTDGCSDSVNCACAVKNGGEIPFNYDGAIVEAKPLVYECGPMCKCPPSCHNRVSQHGIKYPLEVFKTKSVGWGVRSLTSIPSGSFICEYTGEMIEESEANRRANDAYLFDIGQNYYDKSLWEGLSTCIPGLQQDASSEVVEDECFTIDAANCGNIGRFINHSCSPNLYAQNVLYDHDDKRMPHIMFFAAENISPLEELTYHYNYTLDQVHDLDGNIKTKKCYCGSVECTGRLY